MLKSLIEYVIAAVEFFESEARALRRGVMRLGIGLMLLAVVGLLLTGAVALLFAGLYLWLATVVSPAAAVSLTGVAVLFVAGVMLWTARSLAS